jgi:hypothetical protein
VKYDENGKRIGAGIVKTHCPKTKKLLEDSIGLEKIHPTSRDITSEKN